MNEPEPLADLGLALILIADGANPPMTIEDAREIAELCALAGCPERIAGFLAAVLGIGCARASAGSLRHYRQEDQQPDHTKRCHHGDRNPSTTTLVLAARARADRRSDMPVITEGLNLAIF